jgi:hypothetical protein
VVVINNGINSITGGKALFGVVDPTALALACPLLPPMENVLQPLCTTPTPAPSEQPSYLFWALFLLGFAYLASVLPIWPFAQPVNYIGFWITLIVMG